MSALDVEVGRLGGGLGVGALEGAVDARAGHGEERRCVAVLAGGDVGGVIWHDEDAPLGVALELLEDGADDVPIDGLDAGDLGLVVGLVAGLVGGLDVGEDQVVFVQRGGGGG